MICVRIDDDAAFGTDSYHMFEQPPDTRARGRGACSPAG